MQNGFTMEEELLLILERDRVRDCSSEVGTELYRIGEVEKKRMIKLGDTDQF